MAHDDSEDEELPDVPWGVALPEPDDEDYDPAVFQDLSERERFLNAVARGTPPLLAGIEVGWTPAKYRRIMADKEFSALTTDAHLVLDARVEGVILQKALAGVEWAVKLYAFNRMKHNWKDVRHIDVTHTLDMPQHVIAAAREEARVAIGQLARSGGIAELQRSFIEADLADDD